MSVAVEVIKDYEKQPSFHLESKKEFRQCVYRLCFSSTVINCRKYVGFTAKYGQILNAIIPEHQAQKNKYIALINNNTAIKALRNDYIAHVQSSFFFYPFLHFFSLYNLEDRIDFIYYSSWSSHFKSLHITI